LESITIDDVTIYYPEFHPERRWMETVCDQWECPSRTWLKDRQGNETICMDKAPVELPVK
jgi:hypothetical protein